MANKVVASPWLTPACIAAACVVSTGNTIRVVRAFRGSSGGLRRVLGAAVVSDFGLVVYSGYTARLASSLDSEAIASYKQMHKVRLRAIRVGSALHTALEQGLVARSRGRSVAGSVAEGVLVSVVVQGLVQLSHLGAAALEESVDNRRLRNRALKLISEGDELGRCRCAFEADHG